MQLVSVFDLVSRLVYPPFCQGCRSFLDESHTFCRDCLKGLTPVISREIDLGKGRRISVCGVTRYEGAVQRLIRAKNHNQRTAAWQLGVLVSQHAPCSWSLFDAVVPVPLHWRRWWRRGFNQSEIMAQVISEHHNLSVYAPLVRVKSTKFQAESPGRQARIDNLLNAFDYVDEQKKIECVGRSLLIVDDVVTSGATVAAMANLLYRAGAKHVGVVVAARG